MQLWSEVRGGDQWLVYVYPPKIFVQKISWRSRNANTDTNAYLFLVCVGMCEYAAHCDRRRRRYGQSDLVCAASDADLRVSSMGGNFLGVARNRNCPSQGNQFSLVD
jgi:hypothetical protein